MAVPAFALLVHGFLPATQTVPEGDVQLETAVDEHVDLGSTHERSTSLRWTPSAGVTHGLELAFPVELVTRTVDDAAPFSGIVRYGAELRYRIPYSLARVALSRDPQIQTQVRVEVGVAAACEIGRIHLSAAAGLVTEFNIGHLHDELRPGLAGDVRVSGGLRLGAELYAEHSFDAVRPSWAVVGPDIGWTRGRFWVSGVVGIGIENVTAVPRLNAGVAW